MTPERQQPAGEDARRRLKQAALESFAARGFHGTTTRDIAAGAGMSPAALYVHHRSKEELLHELSRWGHDATIGLVEQAIASSADPVEQLRSLVGSFVRHHAESHISARVVNYELAALSPAHQEEIARSRHRIQELTRGVVEAGVAAGAFRTSSPSMAAVMVLSLAIDVARWYDDQGEWSPDDLAVFYAAHVLRMLGAADDEIDPPRRNG